MVYLENQQVVIAIWQSCAIFVHQIGIGVGKDFLSSVFFWEIKIK